MAAPVLTLTGVAVIAGIPDITALTGGMSDVVGYTGADYRFMRGGGDGLGVNKIQGGTQIVFTKDASANIASQELTYLNISYYRDDALNNFGGDPAFITSNSCRSVRWAPLYVGAGFSFSIAADQKLRTLRGIWAVTNGLFRMTATAADGSLAAAPLTFTTPNAYYATYDAWWECKIRSLNPTTINFVVERLSGATEEGYVKNQVTYLQVPTLAARPTSVRRIATYQGKFGGRS